MTPVDARVPEETVRRNRSSETPSSELRVHPVVTAREAPDVTASHTRLVGRTGLIELLGRWDSLGTALTVDVIRNGLERLSLAVNAIRSCIGFDEETYRRIRIHANEAYEVLILCWRSGQGSPIHDHGTSACGFLVVEGVAMETSYLPGDGMDGFTAGTRRIDAGTVAVSRGVDLHKIENREPPGSNLITLHVYSPLLTNSRYYRIENRVLVPCDSRLITLPETVSAQL